ncbi:MAG: DUF3854 domain-containing protein, partial [Leptolyngbya sp. SIO3F4]|nr:DUF3854 domain-containing protein [Leptolyngbya sp. SIO3F4]
MLETKFNTTNLKSSISLSTQLVHRLETSRWAKLRRSAPSLPESPFLNKKHEKDFAKSGITSAQATDQCICSVTAEQAKELTGHYKAGWIVPYFDEAGKNPQTYTDESGRVSRPFFRIKVDEPKDGAKYLSPIGSGTHVYFPLELNQKGKKRSSANEILITEGEKKSLALMLDGRAAIGLGGIWGSRIA